MTTANFAPNQRRRISLAACKNPAAEATLSTHICKHFAISITIGLLFGTIGTAGAALSATTAKTIQGSGPYLSYDGGVTKATDISELFKITVSDGTVYDTTAGSITLPSSADTFNDVKSFIPAGTSAISIADIAKPTTSGGKGYYYDADDDLLDISNSTGTLQATWKDKYGTVISGSALNSPLSVCSSPYTLTLTAVPASGGSDVILSSTYGDPRVAKYAATTHSYTINSVGAGVCFATPDMTNATGQYAGSTNMWNTTQGFITQSTTPSTYGLNFPTTGANNLYFDLKLSGLTSPLTWNPVTVNGITATMTNSTATSVRVKLNGPTTARPTGGSSPWTAPFILQGTDSSGVVLTYGFTLQHWYINFGTFLQWAELFEDAYCPDYNYFQPTIAQLSNASGGTWPAPIGEPSGGNHYTRHIAAGLLSEWGDLTTYTGAGFEPDYYWTLDRVSPDSYEVLVTDGSVRQLYTTDGYGICIYPN